MRRDTHIRHTLLLVATIAIGVLSCRPGPGDPSYVSWVRDYQNGMHVRHVQNDLMFDLQFQPSEYVWLQRNGKFDATAFNAQKAEFDQMQYFTLSIHSRDGRKDVIGHRAQGDVELANKLLYYFSYRFQDDIVIDEGPRRWPCTLYHYEQHGTKAFVLGFPKGDGPVTDLTFTIDSPALDSIPVKIKVSTPKAL
jgi:hypothetical protein